jgi:hypothetical protein
MNPCLSCGQPRANSADPCPKCGWQPTDWFCHHCRQFHPQVMVNCPTSILEKGENINGGCMGGGVIMPDDET